MANVLILSNNPELAAHCKMQLAIEHDSLVKNNIADALPLIGSQSIAVAIVDVLLIGHDDTQMQQLKHTGIKLLLIGHQWCEQKQINALVAGAKGYCECAAVPEMLLKAVNSILRGDIWIQRHLVPKVIGTLITINNAQSNTSVKQDKPATSLLNCLTAREMEVANLISIGKSNRIIAETLNISERTVKAHLTSIFQKLNVQDRLRLAILIKETLH